MGQVLLRYAGASVADLQNRMAAGAGKDYQDLAAPGLVFDGVFHQAGGDALKVALTGSPRKAVRQFRVQGHASLVGNGFQLQGGFHHHGGDIHLG